MSDGQDWAGVKTRVLVEVNARLQNRYDAVGLGADFFKREADGLVASAIQKPPGKLEVFDVVAGLVAVACKVVLPEEGLLLAVVEAANTVREKSEQARHLQAEVEERAVANSVEDAQKYLAKLTQAFASDVRENAWEIKADAEHHASAALDQYITDHPQPFREDDAFFYEMCDAIGVTMPIKDRIEVQVFDRVMPKFREQVQDIAARLHFFHEIGNDVERLNFLIDIAEGGTDPDKFLELIGGDRTYWDRFLAVYRSDGRAAAFVALEQHLVAGG